MHNQLRFIIAAAALLAANAALAQDAKVGSLVGDVHQGQQVYRRYCIGCHGARGDGLGDNAPWVDPKPRDFTSATFKCRSTPTGTLPTDEDLFNTIGRGLHATAMPSWGALTKQQRINLVAYIKSFSPRFKEEKAGDPIPIPAESPATAESVHRGAELFQKMNCWSCHGKQGHGNGPSSVGLTDSKGFPITPYDFTSTSQFKCGEGSHDLYRAFMTGLDGTPMPSFADSLEPSAAWDLVHYVQTFGTSKGRVKPVPAGTIRASAPENRPSPADSKDKAKAGGGSEQQ
ncbi:MAG: cytochrome c [Acidobacteria bacterium]|nr:cytochrome c [Acidobacteriota bacterium]